jgi:hypothetical protein
MKKSIVLLCLSCFWLLGADKCAIDQQVITDVAPIVADVAQVIIDNNTPTEPIKPPVVPPVVPVVPIPFPPTPEPNPIPTSIEEHIVAIDLVTFGNQVRKDFNISSRDSMIHAIWAAALYGWPIGPSGTDPEWDSYVNPTFYPKIEKYMCDLVDKVAERMKANPLLTVTGVTGDPGDNVDLQGKKYAVGVYNRLRLQLNDEQMEKFRPGQFTEGSI